MPQDYYEHRERRYPEREPRPAPREGQEPSRRPRKKKRRSAGRSAALVLLYVTMVIGLSVLLACVGWIAAGDVLALNKEFKEITFTITPEEDFDDVKDRLKKEGMIEYKALFDLFASVTHKKDKLSPGTYTLNTDMDYRALPPSAPSRRSPYRRAIISTRYSRCSRRRGWPRWRSCGRRRLITTMPSPSCRTSLWGTTAGWRAI